MVKNCCVKGCHNKQSREKDRRYFSIPTVVTTKGKIIEDLTTRRRREWVAQLRLKAVTFGSDTSNRSVCSDHFVNGVKAYIMDVTNPSWKPTLKLGYEAYKPTLKLGYEAYKPTLKLGYEAYKPTLKLGYEAYKELKGNRYERHQNRNSNKQLKTTTTSDEVTEVETDAHFGEDILCTDGTETSVNELTVQSPPPDSDEFGTFCQTKSQMSSLTVEEEQLMRGELNRLTQENLQLKEALASKKMTLQSLHDQDDTVKYFTGLTDFSALSVLFGFLASHMPQNTRRALTHFQALMLTLIHMRLNTPLKHLAYIFCVSRSTASKVFYETIHVLYYRLNALVFWPDRHSIHTSLPVQFKGYPWRRVVSIIDCFEIFIERPSSSDTSALTWSNYKHNNTIKYLISITPQGHISFISKGWGGRASDKKVCEGSGFLNNLLPNDIVLADRGFDIAELVAMQGAEVKIPAFTKGKLQLSATEIESTRNLARLLIHVERVIGMVSSKYTILSSTIPIELLFTRTGEQVTTLDKIVTVSCALVNICPPIVT